MESFSYQIFNAHSFLVLTPPKTFEIIGIFFGMYQSELYSNVCGRMSNT